MIIIVVLVAGGDSDGDDKGEPAIAGKPEVTVPEGPAPTELQVEDLKVGEGPAAKKGDTVSVNYVGVLYDGGEEFDTSWGKSPFEVELGAGRVIEGWDEGLIGMKAGGQRQLIIPPDLAYREQGSPPAIPPNATLIFVVDMESVN